MREFNQMNKKVQVYFCCAYLGNVSKQFLAVSLVSQCWDYNFVIVLQSHARSCRCASTPSRLSLLCWDYNYVIVLHSSASK